MYERMYSRRSQMFRVSITMRQQGYVLLFLLQVTMIM
jgi:hypothetical protein